MTGLSDEDAARVRVGQTLFRQVCIACHGIDGTGSPMRRQGMPEIPDWTSEAFQRQHTDAQIRVSILNGKGVHMPANSTWVTEDQARDLVAYVRTFGPGGEQIVTGASDAEFVEAVRRLEQQLDELHKQLQDVKGKP